MRERARSPKGPKAFCTGPGPRFRGAVVSDVGHHATRREFGALRPVGEDVCLADEIQKTRDKIRKLLRLAESANVHEAANAAARARALMDQHRIEAASLIEGSPDSSDGSVTDHPDAPLWSFVRPPRWRIGLAAAVAETGGCRVYLRNRAGTVDAVIVGRSCDADDVRFLESLLATQIERLVRPHSRGKGRRWTHAFRLGAVAEVGERLRQAHRTETEAATVSASANDGATGPSTSAALARLAALERAVDRWMADHLDLRPSRRRSVRADAQGFASGRAAAQSIALRRQAELPPAAC